MTSGRRVCAGLRPLSFRASLTASKKAKSEEVRRARLDPGPSSASSQEPGPEACPMAMVSAPSEPSSSLKRPHLGGGGDNAMVPLSCPSALAGVMEKFDTEVYEKFDRAIGTMCRENLFVQILWRKLGVSTMKEMGVWEVIPRPKGEKVITPRRVDVNKKDEANPKYRSRLVARELIEAVSWRTCFGSLPAHLGDFYASMPPMSALRVLFALATSKKTPRAGRENARAS